MILTTPIKNVHLTPWILVSNNIKYAFEGRACSLQELRLRYKVKYNSVVL